MGENSRHIKACARNNLNEKFIDRILRVYQEFFISIVNDKRFASDHLLEYIHIWKCLMEEGLEKEAVLIP